MQGLRLIAASGIALLAAACGGGGGGSGSATPLPGGTVAITATNAPDVATAMASGQMGNEMEGLTGVFTISSTGSPAAAVRSRWLPASVLQWVLLPRQTDALRQAAGVRHAQTVLPAVPMACDVSGSVMVTVDDVDQNLDLSAGDAMVLVFSNCVQSTGGPALTGDVQVRFESVGTQGDLSLRLTMNGLGETRDGAGLTMTGQVQLAITSLSTQVSQLSMTVTETLTVQQLGTGADRIGLLTGYNETSVYDGGATPPEGGSAGQLSSRSSGTVTSDRLGGRFVLSTPEALVQYDIDANPRSGSLKAAGAGSNLWLVVLSTEQVRLDVDTNGDGSIDTARTLAWDALI